MDEQKNISCRRGNDAFLFMIKWSDGLADDDFKTSFSS